MAGRGLPYLIALSHHWIGKHKIHVLIRYIFISISDYMYMFIHNYIYMISHFNILSVITHYVAVWRIGYLPTASNI